MSDNQNSQLQEVTVSITNIAPDDGTFLTPVWVGFHDGFDTYDRGRPVSPGLESLAEDGDTELITEEFAFSEQGQIDGTLGDGAIAPGETIEHTFPIDPSQGDADFFNYASMILPSNDTFISNGNEFAHQVFDEEGNFIPLDFTVTGEQALDAGSEVNDEIPANTAFFGQEEPDTGVDQNEGVQLAEGFLPPGSGGILDDPMFANADYTAEGYEFARIQVTAEPAPVEVKFNPADNFETGDLPASVATGDFDRDGNLDLITANSLDGTVSLLSGDGNGSFETTNTIDVGGYPFDVAAKYLNDDDDDLDLAVASLFYGDNVAPFLGDSSGNFLSPFSFDLGDNLLAIAPIDLDDEEASIGAERYANDAVVLIQNNSQTVSVIYWDDSNTNFGTATEFELGVQPFTAIAKDFDNDGLEDIVTANRDDGSISLLLGDGNDSFGDPIKTEVGNFPSSLAAEDFDGDGNTDLAIGDSVLDEVSVFLGDGSGNFDLNSTFALRFSPSSVAAGDFNSDGQPDLAVTNPDSDRVLILDNITYSSDELAPTDIDNPDPLSGNGVEDRYDLAADGETSIIDDFDDGLDYLALSSDWNFGQLSIDETQNGTAISITDTGEVLAELTGISPDQITEMDFAFV